MRAPATTPRVLFAQYQFVDQPRHALYLLRNCICNPLHICWSALKQQSRGHASAVAWQTLLALYRALGRYAAAEEQEGSEADKIVDSIFRSLEQFDFVLFEAVRQKKSVPLGEADDQLKQAASALDR